MIHDRIENSDRYTALGDGFSKGFDFIKKAVCEKLPVGKYEICGSDVYAMIQEYTSKPDTDALFEGHKKYIDIQYVISGIENIGIIDISKAEVQKEYSDDSDAAFYNKNDKCGKLILEAGDFAIFYPNDLHMPGIAFCGTSSEVKKIVVKVSVNA